MKTSKMLTVGAVAGMATIAALSACHTATSVDGTSTDETMAHAALALSVPPDYSGVTVLIQGIRTPAANGLYGCRSAVTGCFSLDADGYATSLPDGAPGFDELCPTRDVPVGDWTFSYTIYSGPDCTGTVLNDGTHNLVCYDINDIAARLHPNQTFQEPLGPGENENRILCLTVDAEKTFNLNVCEVLDGDPNGHGPIVLDCGCAPCAPDDVQCQPQCLCPGNYGALPVLPADCQFDESCSIVCIPD